MEKYTSIKLEHTHTNKDLGLIENSVTWFSFLGFSQEKKLISNRFPFLAPNIVLWDFWYFKELREPLGHVVSACQKKSKVESVQTNSVSTSSCNKTG